VIRPGSDEKGRKKPGRRVDVRQSLEAADLPSAAVAEQLRRDLGWVPGRIVTFRVAVSTLGSARPLEVVEALAGPEAAAGASLARLGLCAVGGRDERGVDALDLAAVRAGLPRFLARAKAAAESAVPAAVEVARPVVSA
jgi:hypothetical protein